MMGLIGLADYLQLLLQAVHQQAVLQVLVLQPVRLLQAVLQPVQVRQPVPVHQLLLPVRQLLAPVVRLARVRQHQQVPVQVRAQVQQYKLWQKHI